MAQIKSVTAQPDKALIKTAKESSRYAFIAEQRGGPLTKTVHHQLMSWARACSEHILLLIGENIDNRLIYALQVAEAWENNLVPTGVAMKASLGAHAVARASSKPVLTAVARSIGHAVATAHMADHSMGAALYALKAVKFAGKSICEEKAWQTAQLQLLPTDIAKLVLATMKVKEKGFDLN